MQDITTPVKPFAIYKCLPNYSEDGKYYMYVTKISNSMVFGGNGVCDKAKSLGLVYGPVIHAIKHGPCETD